MPQLMATYIGMTSLASDDSALTSRVARLIGARMASACSSSDHWCEM